MSGWEEMNGGRWTCDDVDFASSISWTMTQTSTRPFASGGGEDHDDGDGGVGGQWVRGDNETMTMPVI